MKSKFNLQAKQDYKSGLRMETSRVNSHINRIYCQWSSDLIPVRNNFVVPEDISTKTNNDPNSTIQLNEQKGRFRLNLLQGINQLFTLHFSKKLNSQGHRSWKLKRAIQPDEHFYGLGDKPVRLDLRGRKTTNWGTDTYAYAYGADPLYKNIPFVIASGQSGCYGLFINNTFRMSFDFGSDGRNFEVSAQGGAADIYIIAGANPFEVMRHYTLFTGVPDLPPLWALGYHQSRWSYYPENKVRKLANKFRKLKIPCDVIHFDIDYMDEYRVFTWDKNRFNKPQKLIADLSKKGFQSVAIIDPGIKIDETYSIYQEGIEGKYFCQLPSGTNFTGPVWPGYCHFPDFTRSAVRHWWAEHVATLFKTGLGGIWNDMNEPALFNKDDMVQTQRTFPDEVIMRWESNPGDHAEGHNVYGHLMTKATWEGALKTPKKRPFVLTRSTFAGGQKYAAVWTGDNIASWEHLSIANFQCQMLSISGFSFCGSDVGGFVGNPDGELFTRWMQLAVFHLFFRTHSSKDFDHQEPWSYGNEYTSAIRSVIEWRYKLLGYIYSEFRQHIQSGLPVIRPFSIVHQESSKGNVNEQHFYFGSALLITPVNEPGQSGTWIDLPEGDWYHLSNKEYFPGNRNTFIQTPLNGIPALLRGGALLPVWPVRQFAPRHPVSTVTLWCGYTQHKCNETTYYSDQYEGEEYKNGDYSLFTFHFIAEKECVKISISHEGKIAFAPKYFDIHLIGFPAKPKSLRRNGRRIKFAMEKQHIQAKIKAGPGEILIQL